MGSIFPGLAISELPDAEIRILDIKNLRRTFDEMSHDSIVGIFGEDDPNELRSVLFCEANAIESIEYDLPKFRIDQASPDRLPFRTPPD